MLVFACGMIPMLRGLVRLLSGIASVIPPAATPTVTAMHEDMHERTCQQEQPRKERDDVRPVFGDQEIAAYRQKAEKDNIRARSEEARPIVAIVVFHFSLHPS
jgi:hypothetical protein